MRKFRKIFVVLMVLCFVGTGFYMFLTEEVSAKSGFSMNFTAGSALYIDGQGGDDGKDGSSASDAVKTFERVKELAKANKNIKEIVVLGTVNAEGDINLEGTCAKLVRGENFKGHLLSVSSGKSAALSNITIDGNGKAPSDKKALISVSGTLDIKDGAVIENNHSVNTSNSANTGGGIYVSRGTVNMTGGVIRNNKANYGGGIYITNKSILNMNGGTVENNEATFFLDPDVSQIHGGGGGVLIADESTFNLSGSALIKNNSAAEIGGGISVGRADWHDGITTFNMTGGTVEGNKAGAAGGGIFVQAGYMSYRTIANISAGKIIENEMTGKGKMNKAFGGGGIYVNGHKWDSFINGELNLTNAVIKNNEAAYTGGGYAGCPISVTKIYFKNGIALYGNKTGRNEGNEIYLLSSSIYGTHSGKAEYEISNSMLGGTPYRWKNKQGEEIPLNKLSGILPANSELELSTDVKSDENAENLAKVIIAGNKSVTRGGGIGSNGTVTMGTSELTELDVEKKWDDAEEADKRPASIKINLYRHTEGMNDKVKVGYETIKPENDLWKVKFTNLPKTDGAGRLYVYTAGEEALEGYVSESGKEGDKQVIINTPSTEIKVEKKWIDEDDKDGLRPKSIKVQLYAGGEKQGNEKELSASTGWSHTWKKLPKIKNGKRIVYSVKEVDTPKGYESKTDEISSGEFIITNTHKPEAKPEFTEIRGKKVWKDAGNKDGIRPKKIVVNLQANGIKILSKVVTADDGWSYRFGKLPAAKDGKKIIYRVTEDKVKGYISKVDDSNLKNVVITNTHKVKKPEKPEVNTGDSSKIALYLKAAAGCIAVLAILMFLKKKQK